jgi:hypothetical protein
MQLLQEPAFDQGDIGARIQNEIVGARPVKRNLNDLFTRTLGDPGAGPSAPRG